MSLQTAPIAAASIPTEKIASLPPSIALCLQCLFVLRFFLALGLLQNLCCLCTLLAKHQFPLKQGLNSFEEGLGLYLSEINTGGEAASSRIILRERLLLCKAPAAGCDPWFSIGGHPCLAEWLMSLIFHVDLLSDLYLKRFCCLLPAERRICFPAV